MKRQTVLVGKIRVRVIPGTTVVVTRTTRPQRRANLFVTWPPYPARYFIGNWDIHSEAEHRQKFKVEERTDPVIDSKGDTICIKKEHVSAYITQSHEGREVNV